MSTHPILRTSREFGLSERLLRSVLTKADKFELMRFDVKSSMSTVLNIILVCKDSLEGGLSDVKHSERVHCNFETDFAIIAAIAQRRERVSVASKVRAWLCMLTKHFVDFWSRNTSVLRFHSCGITISQSISSNWLTFSSSWILLPKFRSLLSAFLVLSIGFLTLFNSNHLLSISLFWTTTSYISLAAFYGVFSLLIRIELSVSGAFLFSDGNQNSFYRAVTSHGVGMVFLFIMPGLISALGNYAIPHTYAGIDFAAPRLNNLAFWLSVFAIQLLLLGISHKDGVSAGWTLYYPLTGIDFSSSSSVSLAIVFLHVLGLSSEFGAITFLVSLHISRNMGLPILNFCLISWSIAVVSILLITTLPVLGAGITLIFAERQGNVSSLLGNFVDGSDPVAFQHLFWFFGHPEVYVIILPAFGIISEKLRDLAASKSISHPGMTLAIWSIGLVGYFVWAHHMFTVGMGDLTRIYFSAATAIIGIPTAIKIFSWSLGLSELRLRNFEYVISSGFVICFVFGGFTGLLLANQAIDLAYHDTYFVVGHFHFVLSIAAAIAAFLLALGYFSAVNSVNSNSSQITVAILLGISAVNVLFVIQHVLGLEGHPRRIFLSPEVFVSFHNFANAGLPVLILVTQLSFLDRFSVFLITNPTFKFR